MSYRKLTFALAVLAVLAFGLALTTPAAAIYEPCERICNYPWTGPGTYCSCPPPLYTSTTCGNYPSGCGPILDRGGETVDEVTALPASPLALPPAECDIEAPAQQPAR
jgi:hypothetical protein